MATTTIKKPAQRAANKPKAKAAVKTIEPAPVRSTVDPFFWASVGITGFSLVLKLMGKKNNAAFAGRLAAQTLLFGIYKKMKK
jgi:hypothetical protein